MQPGQPKLKNKISNGLPKKLSILGKISSEINSMLQSGIMSPILNFDNSNRLFIFSILMTTNGKGLCEGGDFTN